MLFDPEWERKRLQKLKPSAAVVIEVVEPIRAAGKLALDI
jgi:hypothetical protein